MLGERKVENWIEGFLSYTDNTEAPDSFRYWTAVSVLAACLQRRCCLEVGLTRWFPNFYIILVGPSASRKGTAMGPGLDLLLDSDIRIAANSTTRQALIRRLKETSYTEIDAETGEMLYHASMTIFSKEFTVFLGYKNEDLISALCDWYDCDKKWSYETISRSVEEIIGVWVNIIGATTPELIAASMPTTAIGAGLTSRIIFVYEERKGKIVTWATLSQNQVDMRASLLSDLGRICLLKGQFKPTPGYREVWEEWYEREGSAERMFNDRRFDGYAGRRATHVAKLSMIMSANDSDDLIITAEHLMKAINVLGATEIKMPKVFAGVGNSRLAQVQNQITSYILQQKKCTTGTVFQIFNNDVTFQDYNMIISSLQNSGIIKLKDSLITIIER